MTGDESPSAGTDQPEPEPMHDDRIRKAIFNLTLELHKQGHTRKEIVARLREVADDYEDHFSDSDSWDKAPCEKDVTLPGDFDAE